MEEVFLEQLVQILVEQAMEEIEKESKEIE